MMHDYICILCAAIWHKNKYIFVVVCLHGSNLWLSSCCFCKGLMVSDTSPVKDYYPIDFDTDLNGKLQDWEAVVLIPFIDEVVA